eukprot:82962-Pelagomonas_calceolata.AAC.1
MPLPMFHQGSGSKLNTDQKHQGKTFMLQLPLSVEARYDVSTAALCVVGGRKHKLLVFLLFRTVPQPLGAQGACS